MWCEGSAHSYCQCFVRMLKASPLCSVMLILQKTSLSKLLDDVNMLPSRAKLILPERVE